MRIIYMHHAERNIGPNHNDPILRQEENITELGIEETNIIGKQISKGKYNIKTIITSPYVRCKHTAEIINSYLNVPIIEDERFNENEKGENFSDLWKRIMEALDDIVNNDNYTNEDDIIVVTSGVNITGFICYFYNIDPTNAPTFSQGTTCSPVNFIVHKED